ncbi:MAG TPA: cell envelope integrity EipB family protein [Microvirga sp.]|jgi:hypothetical protein|nr:cell envelope integrity EipB family protein [Microvirga sp.]
MPVRRILLSAVLAGLAAPCVAAADKPVELVPHRAVYDLSLLRSGGSNGLDSARGRIAIEFGGDACEGYTTKFRQVTILESSEAGPRTIDTRTTTFEAADGAAMRFKTDSRDGRAEEAVDGEANVTDGSLSIRLKQPRSETLRVSAQPVFPSAHMKRLIEAGRAGETSLAVKVFDGSDDGKKVYDTYAVIGRRIEAGAGGILEKPATQDAVARLPRWPVSISYFKAGAGDQTPVYGLAFELYENGISRALRLDYGDFALKGELQSLEVSAPTPCSR